MNLKNIFVIDRVIRKRNKANRNLYENINIKEIYNKKNEKNYFLIMDRLGDSLRNIHEKLCNKFSFKTAAQIGLQMVNSLEKVHECGLVYNDIKPDNILVGDIEIIPIIDDETQPNVDIEATDCSSIRLIDFGFSTAFKDTDGEHIKDNVPDKFQGSILFASKNAFNFTSTSRRDDFISLCYLLIYLVNENQLGLIT
jgi:serine/threonine protein kinase